MPKLLNSLMTILLSSVFIYNSEAQNKESSSPNSTYPYLLKGLSSKRLVETARDHQWSINFEKKNSSDTINIIALRVQFKRDTSALTTGDGRFFTTTSLSEGDRDEYLNYTQSDTMYKYDRLPHDSLYFANQLEMVKSYFKKVSKGKLILTSTIYPKNGGDKGYEVNNPLPYYSPGYKKKKETYDEYYNRKTLGLVKFIKDAIISADTTNPANSPFAKITFNPSDSTFRDELGRKTVFLIFHAGASYMTNGGDGRAKANDTPSDIIDAFVYKDFFKLYRDSIGLKTNGVTVKNNSLLIDEIMMCSETSNQDGMNWGIQGILVNQIARQLGIPDLFSTASGISAIGAFCIMDFAGYSAGKGFIPPYPSAWVRAFMGWDEVAIASPGERSNYSVKSLTSVLDRDSFSAQTNDTTILLVPINDHEYYLFENRQRNLTRNKNLFRYDTIDHIECISEYPQNVNIDANVIANASGNPSRVIQKVNNNDVSIPASGVLIWHIDEHIIKGRLSNNFINADSLYRGISLVEADGINDLGVTFQNAFYSAVFDYGGSEDVFPHQTHVKANHRSSITKIDSLGPYTLPSTRSNDGGHTFLKMKVTPGSTSVGEEVYHLAKGDGDHYITNYSDSVFNIRITQDHLAQFWPKKAAPENYHELLLADLDAGHAGKELFLLSKSGRFYLWPTDTSKNPYNKRMSYIDRSDLHGNIFKAADTIRYLDSIPNPVSMPSLISNIIYIPSSNGLIYRIISISEQNGLQTDSMRLSHIPSTYVCNFRDSLWAIGTRNGRVIFGHGSDTSLSIKLKSDSAVTAIVSIRESGKIAVIQNNGTLSICNSLQSKPDTSFTITTGIGPYNLVTGDIDKDSASEIVVCDSRHGLWVFKTNMSLAPGWETEPNDWCNTYTYTTSDKMPTGKERALYTVNTAAPALADINKDGYLDIVLGGTNGIYAFNYKGVLINKWPAYLDKRYWYQRGSVTSTPIIVTGNTREPLVLFSSATGENPTFSINKLLKADKNRGIIWFNREDGKLDSIWDLSSSYIDTILTMGDSLALPYVLPGGFVDAINKDAKRPASKIMGTYQSSWPLTTGTALETSPMAGLTNSNTRPDIFAVSKEGWVYRWTLPKDILPDSLFWAQNGYDPGRSFAYGGLQFSGSVTEKEPVSLYSYPNPFIVKKNIDKVTFRYKFSAPATNVRLDIFTYSGFKIYSKSSMGNPPLELTGSYPDWNELVISLKDFGPAVYRCRMEATIKGKKQVKYWKMAVVK